MLTIMKYCKRCYFDFYCLYIWLNICEYLCDVKIFRYTLCVKCHVILLCVMYKVYIIYFYCKNYVVSNVVSSQLLCFLNLCHYKSSIELITLLVMKIYVRSIVSKSMFWYVWHKINTQTWSYMLTNLEWICNLTVTYRKRFRTKYLCSALVSAKTKMVEIR
jgi:hypothetical protein